MTAICIHSWAGGLGNRLPAIIIAAEAARREDIPLYVWSPHTEDCNGLIPDGFDVDSIPATMVGQHMYETACHEHKDARRFERPEIFNHFWRMAAALTVAEPEKVVARDFPKLRPSACVAVRLAELEKRLPLRQQRIGVHVRRTDFHQIHRTHAQHDVNQTARLDLLAEQRPDAVFVLAADNRLSAEYFAARYGKRVVLTGTQWHGDGALRHTPLADAINDLFALANTSLVIGTHHSTFSQMAGWLGGVPLERP